MASSCPGIEAEAADNVYVPLLDAEPLEQKPAKLICFYLPQYHPIPENDAWWGRGFTEWNNVRQAEPQFEGHDQPRVPGELGYYHLLDPAVQRRQVELARLYGVGGFCFYFYWFGGRRLLEAPLVRYLEDSSLDLPFCLCWANENWTRRWDGRHKDILIAQDHCPEDDLAFIGHIARYLEDSRYIRIQGKPLLLVYRPHLLPSAKKTVRRWRRWCRDCGIGEIYLACTQSFEVADPARYGFDAAVEFPPNNSAPPDITDRIKPLNATSACTVYDWRVFVERSRQYRTPPYKLFRGVCPSWDNTARRCSRGIVFQNASPLGYQQWLSNAISDTRRRHAQPDERLVFINAWNEWAESAYLEPDQRRGYAYLEATRMALVRNALNRPRESAPRPLAIVIHAFYEPIFEEILDYTSKIQSVACKLYVTTPVDKKERVRRCLAAQNHDFTLMAVENRGRDILPFLNILPRVAKDGHHTLLKVHTKKSLHRDDGTLWRRDLFDQLLTDKAVLESTIHLDANPRIGILGPAGHIVPMSYYWGANSERVQELSARLGVDRPTCNGLNFVAGSMFFARVKALYPILNLALPENEFEPETGQVDGTLAHAIERLFSVSARSACFETTSIDDRTTSNYGFAKRTPSECLN